MTKITIYHNPKCSSSRKALQLLQNHDMDLVIIEYLKTPLSLEELTKLRKHFSLSDFIRTKEPIFKELHLSLDNEPNVMQALLAAPILMQRPIVVWNNQAMIARPPERVLELIEAVKR
jgi:arsenate reductase